MRDYKHNDILIIRGRKYIAKDIAQESDEEQGLDFCDDCAFNKKQCCQFTRLYRHLYKSCWGEGRDFYFKRYNEEN